MSERNADDMYVGGFVGSSQVDPSESLTGDDTEDPLDSGGYVPPDRAPHGWRGETEAESLEGESLDEKLAEEEPDITEADLDRADRDPRSGRLVAPDEGLGPDEESEEIATDVGLDGLAASAEEAAVHVIDEQ